MDPVEMFNLIRRDLESRGWVSVLLVVILALGIAGWLTAFSARGSIPRKSSRSTAISVLSDPFGGQNQ